MLNKGANLGYEKYLLGRKRELEYKIKMAHLQSDCPVPLLYALLATQYELEGESVFSAELHDRALALELLEENIKKNKRSTQTLNINYSVSSGPSAFGRIEKNPQQYQPISAEADDDVCFIKEIPPSREIIRSRANLGYQKYLLEQKKELDYKLKVVHNQNDCPVPLLYALLATQYELEGQSVFAAELHGRARALELFEENIKNNERWAAQALSNINYSASFGPSAFVRLEKDPQQYQPTSPSPVIPTLSQAQVEENASSRGIIRKHLLKKIKSKTANTSLTHETKSEINNFTAPGAKSSVLNFSFLNLKPTQAYFISNKTESLPEVVDSQIETKKRKNGDNSSYPPEIGTRKRNKKK